MCSHPHKCTMSTEIVYMVLERSPLYYRTMNIICKRIISRISSCKVVDGDEAAVGRELDFCLAILISSAELESLEFQNELKEWMKTHKFSAEGLNESTLLIPLYHNASQPSSNAKYTEFTKPVPDLNGKRGVVLVWLEAYWHDCKKDRTSLCGKWDLRSHRNTSDGTHGVLSSDFKIFIFATCYIVLQLSSIRNSIICLVLADNALEDRFHRICLTPDLILKRWNLQDGASVLYPMHTIASKWILKLLKCCRI